MQRKSRLVTFLLSFIPGLSHFYIGYADRGIIYFLLVGVVTIGSVGMGILTSSEIFLLTLIGGAALIWLVALIDAFNLIGRDRYIERGGGIEAELIEEESGKYNRKIITLGLSIIPGAGHMYLGYQEKGLIYMGIFFFTIFFMGWLNLSFLLFLIPLIWFYTFFDAFHIVNGNQVVEQEGYIFNLLPTINHEYIGKGLIGLGVMIILQKIFLPIVSIYVNYRIRNIIQTSIVSLIFIFLGVRILQKNTHREVEEEDED